MKIKEWFSQPHIKWTIFSVFAFTATILILFSSVLPLTKFFSAPDSGTPNLVRNYSQFLLAQFFEAASNPFTLLALLPESVTFELTYWVSTFLIILAGVYASRGRGLSWQASWFGGFAVGFCGYMFTLFNAGHRGIFHLMALALFAFGLLLRCFKLGEIFHFAMLGTVLAWGVKEQPDILVLLFFPLGLYAFWLTFSPLARFAEPLETIKKTWPKFLISIVVFVAVGIGPLMFSIDESLTNRKAQISDSSAASADKERASWIFATNWSLPKTEILEFAVPGIFGDESFKGKHPYHGKLGAENAGYRQHTLYMGILTLIFASVAWRRRHEPDSADLKFWVLLFFCSLILACGRNTPIYRLIYSIPYVNLIRAPVKFLHFSEFALGMIAALGFAQTFEKRDFKALRISAASWSLVLLAILIFVCTWTGMKDAEYAKLNIFRSLGLCVATVFCLWIKPVWLAQGVVTILLIFDLSSVASRYLEPLNAEPTALANTLLRYEPNPNKISIMNLMPTGREIKPESLTGAGMQVLRDNDYQPEKLKERGVNFIAVPPAGIQYFNGKPIYMRNDFAIIHIPENTKLRDDFEQMKNNWRNRKFYVIWSFSALIFMLGWAIKQGCNGFSSLQKPVELKD